jgi:hypothetical protein
MSATVRRMSAAAMTNIKAVQSRMTFLRESMEVPESAANAYELASASSKAIIEKAKLQNDILIKQINKKRNNSIVNSHNETSNTVHTENNDNRETRAPEAILQCLVTDIKMQREEIKSSLGKLDFDCRWG